MADSPFIGPSYSLGSRPASVQRTVNLMPVPLEPGNERTGWVFKDVPGLVAVDTTLAPLDPYWDSVILLAPFSGATNGQLIPINTAGIDVSCSGHQLAAASASGGSIDAGHYYTVDAYLSLPVSKYGETTAGCNTADTLRFHPHAEFAMGTGDFTIEMDAAQQFAGIYVCSAFVTGPTGQAGVWCIGTAADAGKLAFYQGTVSSTPAIVSASDVWTDDCVFVNIAYSRVAGVGRLFANGVLVGTAADTTDYNYSGGIGPGQAPGFLVGWKGYLANIRWTAAGRYTASYTPASAPYPVDLCP